MILFYFLLIVGKFTFAYFQIFKEPNFLALGIDLLFIVVLLGLIHLFAPIRSHIYWYAGMSLFVGILMLVCVLYARFYNEIPTYHSFSLIGEVGVVKTSATSLLSGTDWLYILDIVLLPIILYLSIKKGHTFPSFRITSRVYGVSFISILLILSGFTYYMMQQNIISDSKRAKRMGIFTFNISTALTGSDHVKAADITAQNVRDIKGVKLVETPDYFGVAKDKNLIIVQLESLQRNLTNIEINGQSITPTLDSLEKETMYSNKFFQTVSKSNTADAEWSVYTSTFPSGYYTNTQTYGDRIIPSMPRLLGKNDYATETFHTNDASFYNRDEFYPAVGFDKFYDRKFFGDEDVIGFSPSDEVLYNKAFPILEKQYKDNQKFYAQLVSVSSHMPFEIPEDKQEIDLPSDLKDTELGNYFEAVHYADKQLGAFIQKLKDSGIWDDSVVVFYGDHHIIKTDQLPEEQKKYVNRSTELKADPADDYRIPFFLHYPGMENPGEIKTVGGEVDIMPTVMNLLGINTGNQIMFGDDILNTPNNYVPERYTMPEGSYFTDSYMYKPDESFETGAATNYDGTNIELSTEVKKKFDASRKLLQYSDSYVNNLPLRDEDK